MCERFWQIFIDEENSISYIILHKELVIRIYYDNGEDFGVKKAK